MLEQRYSDNDPEKRDIPSFIEPMPPLISNPFMRPRPQKGTNLLELFQEEDSDIEEPELVQVYLRLKPYHAKNNLYEVRSNRCLITSVDTATAGHGRRTQHNVSKMYTFSHIFGSETTQKEIFEHVVKGNLKKLPEGHSFTLLTYGASGSGKTYTLMGTVASPGLVPRSLEYVFRVVDAAQNPLYKPSDGGADKLNYAEQDYELQWVKKLRQISAPLRDKYRRMSAGLCNDFTTSTIDLSNRIRYYVWVSFVEIYNEGIYDLLASDRRTASKLRIREDTNGNVYVKDATQAFVRTGEEAYDVLVAGKHNLQVAATGVHAHSSRSHCIFTITMLTETEEGVRRSCVRLCDLAGCERARMTRNTGARMQESRAINSSLHVLERCLHTLRRKQRLKGEGVVPYRESKLTRLLGAGLSGTRGEAVSMVVTLNPAPEYAHETRHVLQLADVARDIQVNNTIAESQFESTQFGSTQDSTINSSAEVMRLRAENERLHFELIQAQSRHKELAAAMEERQQKSAEMMRELVEETKDMIRKYYEAQIEALRTEMEEMTEEYETKLKEAAAASIAGTPTRPLQNKVKQLMTEITILEEKLNEERVARACAEEEIQHLRACIEERDEKAFEEEAAAKCEEVISFDSGQDSDEEINDPCNESLEPNFKKEDINRFKLLIQEIQSHNSTRYSEHTDDNIDDEMNKSNDTLKDDDSFNETKDFDKLEETSPSANNNTIHEDQETTTASKSTSDLRGTYFVGNIETAVEHNEDVKVSSFARGTYFVSDTDSAIHNSKVNELDDFNESEDDEIKTSSGNNDKNFVRNIETVMEHNEDVKVSSFARGTYFVNENDLAIHNSKVNEFDDNEIEASSGINNKNFLRNIESAVENNEDVRVSTRGTYFVSEKDSVTHNSKLDEFVDVNESEDDEIQVSSEIDSKNENKQCSINIELLNRNQLKIKAPEKSSESVVTKIIRSVKSHQGGDNSLTQFEQLEIAANIFDESRQEESNEFANIKVPNEKRTYFDDDANKNNIVNEKPAIDDSIKAIKQKSLKINSPEAYKKDLTKVNKWEKQSSTNTVEHKISDNDELIKISVLKQKRTFFDNEDVNVEQTHAINENLNDFNVQYNDVRSPSIVKDDIGSVDDFEPSTIKKLLGESFTRPDIIPSAQKTEFLLTKHNSVDIFEGFDSPHVAKSQNIHSVVEKARQSIERLVLEQNSANKVQTSVKREIKAENMFIMDEPIKENERIIASSKSVVVNAPDRNNTTHSNVYIHGNNTTDDFDNICKDLTASRATEFDLLAQELDNKASTEIPDVASQLMDNVNTEKSKVDFKMDTNESETLNFKDIESEEAKYNLRRKTASKYRKLKDFDEDVVESQPTCEKKSISKRSLRLRRRKNQDDEKSDQESDKKDKLKDILNLQKEFSDVMMNIPVTAKETKDIPSPEKVGDGEENHPPILGVQSCPSKSVTRSRRKLFTPRIEPLDESDGPPGDSNERIYVPRPSYHRTRARRRL